MEILSLLLRFLESKKDVPVIIVGDFNAVLDSRLDRFPPGLSGGRGSESRLAQFLEEVGWCDLWRACNPTLVVSNILAFQGPTTLSPALIRPLVIKKSNLS